MGSVGQASMKDTTAGSTGPDPRSDPISAIEPAAPILVAVDFSSEAEEAVVWACEFARRVGAPVEVVHAIHDPPDRPGVYKSDNGDPLEPMADVARRKMESFLDGLRDRIPEVAAAMDMKVFCSPGLPVPTILRTAIERGARQIVVGCRGRNGAARLIYGSVSQEVARKASIPVTVVKADQS